jgi:two-component system KDP operon response regulator KdpE
MSKRVLVVDDEPQILRALRAALRATGYDVEAVALGQEALDTAATWEPDLMILDLGLPDIDGIDVIERLRTWTDLPVIVLSARDARAEKIRALDLGADDFVNKPFAMDELLARMRATMRRHQPTTTSAPTLTFGPLEVDLERTQARLGAASLRLTPTEWSLLHAFVTNPGKLLTQQWILRQVWGHGYTLDQSHYLRIYVRQLRQKLGDDVASPRFVATERGMGYRWIAEGDD